MRCADTEIEISMQQVSAAIKDLKKGKASGQDLLSAEHCMYANDKLCVLLRLCFNSMIKHGHVPHAFSDTIIIPIVKDKKGCLADVNNYRPIALTSVVSKIFEKVMIVHLQEYLFTSDNQFSFKSNHSTDLCVFTLKNIIDFYNSASSPMFICYLDASKAFDRVNFWKLFDKLLNRRAPDIIIRFIMAWYCSQQFTVRWGNTLSLPFSVCNGVRQGGILSPQLFNIYINDLSDVLNSSKVGCIMNGTICNHLCYADDMVLIAPSASALQFLLNLCDNYALSHDIIYNITKSVCMCIQPSNQGKVFNPTLTLSGTALRYVDSHKYLGVYIATSFKDDVNIRSQTCGIYCRGNMLIRNFSNCSDDVKCTLFKSFCTSLYCAPVWNYHTRESFDRMKVAYNRIFRILLGLEHRISMSRAFIERGINPFVVVFRKYIVSFRSRILKSENVFIRTIYESLYFMNCHLFRKWSNTIFNVPDR